MTSKTNSNIALGDVRSTSYNAETANPNGYQGSIDDAIAQIRTEPDEVRAYWPLNISRERFELLEFLRVTRDVRMMSGEENQNDLTVYINRANLFLEPDDDSVEYGIPDAPRGAGKFSLAYAMERWPENFAHSGGSEHGT